MFIHKCMKILAKVIIGVKMEQYINYTLAFIFHFSAQTKGISFHPDFISFNILVNQDQTLYQLLLVFIQNVSKKKC